MASKRLAVGFLCLLSSIARADIANLGVLSYDTFIPGAPGFVGVDAFNISNFTGAFALPPDFPALNDLIFQSATLKLSDGEVFTLGDIGPGVLLDQNGDPFVQVPADLTFQSAEFTATLSELSFPVTGGTFTASSSMIDVLLLPSQGANLIADTDLTSISVNGQFSTPEPASWSLLLAVLLGSLFMLRRRRRRAPPSGLRSIAGLAIALLLWGTQRAQSQAPNTAVTLISMASPSSGEPGVTNVAVTGSNFPAGTIAPTSVNVTLTPAGGSAAVTHATAVTTVIGTTRRVMFTIPAAVAPLSPTLCGVTISGIASTGVAFQSSNSATVTVNPLASVASLTPSGAAQGQMLSVAVVGAFSNFLQGATTANFGPGITVNSTAVTDATHATVNVTVLSTAVAGPRDVMMTTGAETATLASGFTVGGVALTSCQHITVPGSYVLTASISGQASPSAACLAIQDTNNVQVDCQGNAVTGVPGPAVSLLNVQNFSITNCKLLMSPAGTAVLTGQNSGNGLIDSVTFGDPNQQQLNLIDFRQVNNTTISHSFLNAQFQQNYSHGNTFRLNVASCPVSTINRICAAVFISNLGGNTTFDSNQIDGKANPPSETNGADDGIVISDEAGDVMSNNTIKNTWDAGIETAGNISNTQITSNSISNVGLGGITSYYWTSWINVTVTDNIVNGAQDLFHFLRYDGLRPYNWDGNGAPADTGVYFQGNLFARNQIVNGSGFASYMPIYNYFNYYLNGQLVSAIPGEVEAQPSDFKLSNNTFTQNNFGHVQLAPFFSGPVTPGVIVDGGGNICSPPGQGYPLVCN